MVTGRLVRVECVVCGGGAHQRLVPAADVRRQLAWLRSFHERRLRPMPEDEREEALRDRGDFTQDYVTDIVACRGCGLVMRNPRPSPDRVTRAYARDHYGEERLAGMFDTHVPLYRPRAERLSTMLGTGPKRVVEIGSYVGGFLAAAREHGWEAIGVDPGVEVDEFARKKRLRIVRGTIDDLPDEWAAPASIDAVAIWNTFDQLPQPAAVLPAVRRLLHPGGVLALRVPNGACFKALAEPSRRRDLVGEIVRTVLAWNNLLAVPYLAGHSPGTLDRLLGQHGFERIEVLGDTLVRITDAQSTPAARIEEKALKSVMRRLARWIAWPPDRQPLAPWLDAYYRAA